MLLLVFAYSTWRTTPVLLVNVSCMQLLSLCTPYLFDTVHGRCGNKTQVD